MNKIILIMGFLLGILSSVWFYYSYGDKINKQHNAMVKVNSIVDISKQNNSVIAIETREDFYDFKHKFFKDSVFQLGRIKFPLPVILSGIKVRDEKLYRDSSYWKINTWKFLRTNTEEFKKMENWKYVLENQEDSKIETVGVNGSDFFFIFKYKYDKIDKQWYLISYQEFNM